MNSQLTQMLSVFHRSSELQNLPKQKFFRILWHVTVAVFASFPLVLFVSVLIQSVAQDLVDTNAVNQFVQEESLIVVLITAVVIAPIIEEFAFRSWFTRFRIGFIVGLGFFLFFLIPALIPSEIITTLSGGSQQNSLILIAIVSFGPWIIATAVPQSRRFIDSFITRRVSWIAPSIILLFGLIHITNWTEAPVYLWPLLISPQIIAGWIFTYVGVRYTWVWSIYAHMLYNGFLLMGSLLITSYLSDDQISSIASGQLDITTLSQQQLLALSAGGLIQVIFNVGGMLALLYLIIEVFMKNRPKPIS